MSIELYQITQEQYEQVLQAHENHFLDLKSIDIKPAKLSKTISAFANASGGELYIGIEEREVAGNKVRNWKGFTDQEAANAHLQVFEELFPLGQSYFYNFLAWELASGLVLHVTVHKSREIVKASDGEIYIRRGAQNLPVKTDKSLAQLKLDKGITSFEKETVNVETEMIVESEVTSEFLKNVIPTAEALSWLKKQQLIQRDKPTVAGLLLFADEPQAVLPKRCGIKVYRYKTKELEGSRDALAFTPLTIEGCLYQQIEQAVSKTVELVEGIPKLGEQGLEAISYPSDAIHEIVTNAVLHRDYSVQTDIQIRIFDNRIEVESPGVLPGHITPSNILNEQYARNGAIVRIINKFPNPPNQDVGEGLNTAFLAMSKLRLKPPVIEEKLNSVCVYIKHEPLASIEAMIIEYLQDHNTITNRTARALVSAGADVVKDALSKLRNAGVVRYVSGRYWKKVQAEDEQPEELFSLSKNYPLFEKQILDYLEIDNIITNKIAREITGISSQTAVRDIFYKMRDKGLIELVKSSAKGKSFWKKVERN